MDAGSVHDVEPSPLPNARWQGAVWYRLVGAK